ncbi:BCCT family transporter, partial [Actinoplanes sp. NPDC051633]|uniref:BCCT family transporter n=1 Tax=Actinoplanes sp. NPDC051633 TaxID=3155670 RepID=UPI0034462EAF
MRDASAAGKETNFPQDWTIFYWSWWLVYAPFIGLFIARISKGRTLKEVVLGTIYISITYIVDFILSPMAS